MIFFLTKFTDYFARVYFFLVLTKNGNKLLQVNIQELSEWNCTTISHLSSFFIFQSFAFQIVFLVYTLSVSYLLNRVAS